MIERTIQNNTRLLLWLVSLTGIVLGAYLLTSEKVNGLGFPLDDAWIHQTYARNIHEHREWAFVPSQPSAGSTAPIWTLALALGYWLGVDPRAWSYLLGGLLLFSISWVCGLWFFKQTGKSRRWMLWVGSLVILEWHLAWAAVSGMEILALTFVATFVLYRIDSVRFQAIYLGIIIGIGVWIRPDALSLLIPVGWTIFFRDRVSLRRIIIDIGSVCLGLTIMMLPYGLFNYWLSGTLWPSTFYAKSAEYTVLREASFVKRLITQLSLPFVGATIMLIPGLFVSIIRSFRAKNWSKFAPLLWVIGFLAAYAWRLPVIYQHGRYAMPVIPVLLVIGSSGLSVSLTYDSKRTIYRAVLKSWPISVGAIATGFIILGLQAYARDVAIIETEMVQCAKWISENTASDALVASHDIGALGYYSERQILDLAGLISPEVIPIIRDEANLAQFLTENDADYLMTFPGWYPSLVQQAKRVYLTASHFSPRSGGENMAVYKWANGSLPHE